MDKEKIIAELNNLIGEGSYIHYAIIMEFDPDFFKNHAESQQEFAKNAIKEIIFPRRAYQIWYDKAYEWVCILSPRRSKEFEELYTGDTTVQNGGNLHPSHAGIKRFFQRQPIIMNDNVINFFNTFNTNFEQQQDILISARTKIDNPFFNFERDIGQGIYKSTMDIAKDIQEENPRIAGAIAIVVLEVHLKKLAVKNGIGGTEKKSITNYNSFLKRKRVYDSVLADQIKSCRKLRNKCLHTDQGEPTAGDASTIIHIAERLTNEYN